MGSVPKGSVNAHLHKQNVVGKSERECCVAALGSTGLSRGFGRVVACAEGNPRRELP